ncbi:PA4642 family protein [Endozoicomonas sp. SCSIO W0465]|uniref:PA4642 family protein n=1 Tax=Endozoicomonas sp. SCSIO W0465 TaxID=2918516 RepID=UPI0020758B2B|nr:PA4642 family protein [Endozoicomonas sp. SCSIO W0465]USE38578.1 PA4642 family protein [Endozoicomonas sp. SCSIO W0465]
MKKDKQKVIGEKLSDERLKALLTLQSAAGGSRDYHILLRAYRYLRADDFARFIPFFLEAGLDLNARNPDGKTLAETITQHHHGKPYLKALAGGARH